MLSTWLFILSTIFVIASANELNATEKNCIKTLKEAIFKSELETFKKIIEAGCNANIKDNEDNTFIHIASKRGLLDIVKYLVEHTGADVNNKGWLGYTSLHMAASSNNPNNLIIIKYLVENCTGNINAISDYGYLPINIASQNGNLDIVKYLLPKVNINYVSGNTPLHDAAIMGHLNIIKYLVEDKKFDINAKDINDDTPLHWATFYGHLNIVKYMVQNLNANINAQNNRGQTPLQAAKGNPNPQTSAVISWLQNYRA